MAYRLSHKAEEDLIEIFRTGMERFGLQQAELYHKRLEECFLFLADNPLAASEREEIAPPVRIHPTGIHLVIYYVDPGNDILIIRVRHQREDWQSQ